MTAASFSIDYDPSKGTRVPNQEDRGEGVDLTCDGLQYLLEMERLSQGLEKAWWWRVVT